MVDACCFSCRPCDRSWMSQGLTICSFEVVWNACNSLNRYSVSRKYVVQYCRIVIHFVIPQCSILSHQDVLYHRQLDCYFIESASAKVMACCMTAPSHYLNQYWLITKDFLCNSSESNFTTSAHDLTRVLGNYTSKSTAISPWCR